jgi:hypothetical protein
MKCEYNSTDTQIPLTYAPKCCAINASRQPQTDLVALCKYVSIPTYVGQSSDKETNK